MLSKKQKDWWLDAGFSSEAQAVFDLMDTDPDPALKILMATFIDSQVLSGNFALMDFFQFYAMDTAANAVINWIGNYSNGLLVNSPTFDAFDGITGDGATEYIDTQYNPTNDGVNVGQDDIQVGVWVVDNLDGAGEQFLFGGSTLIRVKQQATPRLQGALSTASFNTFQANLFLDNTLYTIKRVDALNQIGIENSAEISAAQASTGVETVDIKVLKGQAGNINAKVACGYAAGAVGFNTTNFHSNLSTFITAAALLG